MSSLCVKFHPSSTPPSDRFWWGFLFFLFRASFFFCLPEEVRCFIQLKIHQKFEFAEIPRTFHLKKDKNKSNMLILLRYFVKFPVIQLISCKQSSQVHGEKDGLICPVGMCNNNYSKKQSKNINVQWHENLIQECNQKKHPSQKHIHTKKTGHNLQCKTPTIKMISIPTNVMKLLTGDTHRFGKSLFFPVSLVVVTRGKQRKHFIIVRTLV